MWWPISICAFLLVVFLVLAKWFPDELRALVHRFRGVSVSKDGFALSFYEEAVRAREHRELTPEAATAQLERFPSGRILWVDDQPANNRLETQALRALDVDVDVATTNREARAYVATRDYDLVVSDIDRSGSEDGRAGLELPAALEASGRRLPVVYYVGTAKGPRTAGGEPVVDMPTELFAEIRRQLEGRASA